MEVYLVGGAVRDQLLGLPVKERDWVVVGATADELLKLGYRRVGKDFPVFLHPETHEEYALARVERKVGHGYVGFSFDTSANVTLEEDLLRRDLTINAIAKKSDGTIVDPYHGTIDLTKKLLRHVSPAFVEDPVRILRVARFAARFASLDFTVASETNLLMRTMVKSGEINALVAERVWKELERGLQETSPAEFFYVLKNCDALPVLFPEFTDSGFKALERATALSFDSITRFAALCHNVSSSQIAAVCARYRAPSAYQELALLVAQFQQSYQQAQTLNAAQLLSFLQHTDAFRRTSRYKQFLLACAAITEIDLSNWLLKVLEAAKNVEMDSITQGEHSGKDIAALVAQKRLESIKKLFA
jgi:tRNA nucleotidyltransferase (CCA-adding enzyme)